MVYRSEDEASPTPKAIERDDFPFDRISQVAELESYRKEIARPIYHIHKWWAQRLGSVFRGILLGTFTPEGTDVWNLFYRPVRLKGYVVYDPFMGSGTTIGEALKLDMRPIGRDINPVAYQTAKTAFARYSRREVIETFEAIEESVAKTILQLYRTPLPDGGEADVLYYFWVKLVTCPNCGRDVDLFKSYIFASHAYPTRHPEARAVCPSCGAINSTRYDATTVRCGNCVCCFTPQSGPASGSRATCPTCNHHFGIAKAIRANRRPPSHRLYAKLVLYSDGRKEYLPTDKGDIKTYGRASSALKLLKKPYPIAPIQPGYNTNQVLGYCYNYWHEMFNDRQLLSLTLLANRIRAISDERLRDLFICLFSGTLEFNNMFASYKGEGTGAVRHMFSHHILKPERTPLEANVWGLPSSSGAFSTLFRSRILRALDYSENPFEIQPAQNDGKRSSKKIYGLSSRPGGSIGQSHREFRDGARTYLSCGDSAHTDIKPESVDAIVTDPPFFDNVHYSQLADFFYVWQRFILDRGGPRSGIVTTRSAAEVQQEDPSLFAARLRDVWVDCHRVLRKSGLLVFTYHHSRAEGWSSLLESLKGAGFYIVTTHPVKAEMAVAKPKLKAKEPVNLDIIIACRKQNYTHASESPKDIIVDAAEEARRQLARLRPTMHTLSRNDVRVVLMGLIVKRLSRLDLQEHRIEYSDLLAHKHLERIINQLRDDVTNGPG